MERSDLPSDADGDAMWRVISDGNDISQPMTIDFFVAFESQTDANAYAQTLSDSDFNTNVEHDNEDDSWTYYCSRVMLLNYTKLIQNQNDLNELAKAHNGYTDGWGTFGNVG